MIGDSTLPIRGDRLYSADIDKERDKLPTPLGEIPRARQVLRIVGEEFGVMYPQHPGTRARGRDHIVAIGEGVEHLQGDYLGIGPVTGVVSGLAATGLSTRDPDRAPRVFEQFDSRKAY